MSKELEKYKQKQKATGSLVAKNKQKIDKKIEALQKDVREKSQQLAMTKMKSMFALGFIMFGFIGALSSLYVLLLWITCWKKKCSLDLMVVLLQSYHLNRFPCSQELHIEIFLVRILERRPISLSTRWRVMHSGIVKKQNFILE